MWVDWYSYICNCFADIFAVAVADIFALALLIYLLVLPYVLAFCYETTQVDRIRRR